MRTTQLPPSSGANGSPFGRKSRVSSASLGAFDALLAATAMANGAEALVSADRDLAAVEPLRFVELGSPAFDRLLPI